MHPTMYNDFNYYNYYRDIIVYRDKLSTNYRDKNSQNRPSLLISQTSRHALYGN